jgi:gliding motility-associated-like protein
MFSPFVIKKFAILICCLIPVMSFAQNQCPPNIDFEMGNFSNWNCSSGLANYSLAACVDGGINTVSLGTPGQIANRHVIISSSNSARDVYGNFPVRCPNGSGYSIKLGDATTGTAKAQAVTYTYSIPASATNFSIVYQYAVVLQDPVGSVCPNKHVEGEKPRFQAVIKNVSTNQAIGCVSFDFFAGSSLPGFLPASNSPLGSVVYYKDWTPVSLNLSAYAGQTIELQFITSNCTRGGHFGYAYVDVNSSCNGAIVGSTICSGDTTVTLTAPYGFQSYQWYSGISFASVLSTNQVLTLSPAPNAGAVYPVVVTPFPGYGCVDTLYATLSLAQKPVSVAGADANACKFEQVQLGTAPYLGLAYLWSPASQVSNPSISNPTGFVTDRNATQFIVTTTDVASGCFSNDTVVLTPKIIDTSLQVIGKIDYCAGEIINSTLKINNSSTAVQWYQTTVPISGANNTSYSLSATGDYWAQFNQLGCTDSTRMVHFDVYPLPKAAIGVDKDSQCITKNSFAFSSNSSISDGTALTYFWGFADGSTAINAATVKSFNISGLVPVKLIANSIYNCKDSATRLVYILPNASPDFEWDNACNNRPTIFSNKTGTNGSLQVNYAWDFGNSKSSILKNPLPFTYDSAGIYNVSLTATALGCEADPKKVVKKVAVHQIRKGLSYPDKLVPAGYNHFIWALFDSAGATYNWFPAIQLSNSNIKAPYFYALNDVQYEITITDKNTCITKDTLQMRVFGKKGWYLPNAFTPNGDGINDIVRPYLIGMKSLTRFSIYNRSGNLLFRSERDGEGWDGTYKGRKQDSGAYVWVLEYIDTDNKAIIQKGSLLLIR